MAGGGPGSSWTAPGSPATGICGWPGGGWGHPGTGREHAVLGGWVADPTAVSARVTEADGRTFSDDVENGVVLFFHTGLSSARMDLLDSDGRVVRSGPLFTAAGGPTRRR